MKIAILSRDGTLYSCKRLREAAMQRGHLVEVIDPLSCYMNISPAASSIQGPSASPFRRGDPADWFRDYLLWDGGAAPV